MATKIQLEAMVTKILELQYYGETTHMANFGPYYITLHTASGKNFSIDTDGKEINTNDKKNIK